MSIFDDMDLGEPQVAQASAQLARPSSQQVFQGPTLPGQDVETFRNTGKDVWQDGTPIESGNDAPGGSPPPTSALAPAPNSTEAFNAGGGSGMFWDAADGWKQIAPNKPDMAAIEAVYNPIMGFLNSESERIRGRMPGVLQAAEEAFDTSFRTLKTSKEQSERGLDRRRTETERARQREEDQTRNLYNELIQQGQQRFGGASSASDAYRAMVGREAQRGSQAIVTQYKQAKTAIADARQKVQEDYTNKKLSLEQQSRATQLQIRNEFEDRLSQIRGMKAESQSAKAAAKLDALRNYKANMQNLRMETMKFQQQLALQAQQNAAQVNQAETAWGNYLAEALKGSENLTTDTGQPTSEYEMTIPTMAGGENIASARGIRTSREDEEDRGIFA